MVENQNEQDDVHAVAAKSASGAFTAFQSVEQELIQTKEALERKTNELALAKERYALAEDATDEGLWDWNPLTRENYLSARWKAMLGFAEHELSDIDDTFFSRIHPDDETRVREALHLHFEKREPYNTEVRLRCKDTSYRWFRTRGKSIRDDSGRVIRMVGSIFDATEQKHADQKLRDSEARFRGTFDNVAVGMVHLSLESVYLMVNQCFCDIVGYSKEELIGKTFRDITHPEDFRNDVAEANEILAGTIDFFTREKRYLRKNAEPVWVSLTVSLQRDQAGRPQYFIGVVRDITGRKRTAQHLEFLIQELSHRSKNLLAVVQAMANHSARTSASMTDFRRRFSQRLQGLAASHDLLVQQNWQRGDLAELVARQLAPFDEIADGRLDAGGPGVSLDAGAVQNIGLLFHELATNASKYGALSVPEGKVIIRWTLDPAEAKSRCLRLSWTERGGPPVETPAHKGFGLIVIERTVAAALNGSVSVEFAPEGLACTLAIPTSHVICRRDARSA
ncbi:MAG TPA: PAS domain-containing protein [Micropepsaceae bacterium]